METVGIAACSNGLGPESREENRRLLEVLRASGREVRVSSCVYAREGPFSGSGKQRAQALTDLFRDPEISEIYDISGGDMANELLDFLDFEVIGQSTAELWGYSDLTVLLNAIYARTGKTGILYQIKNLVRDRGELQQQRYGDRQALFAPRIRMVQGESLEGILVGGNIRCFLKLAGTGYFPDLRDRVLLLEARGGTIPQMVTYLSQLRSLGAFRQVRGILLGTFTRMEAEGCRPDMVTLVRQFAGEDLPIAVTPDIGHGTDSAAVRIGGRIRAGRQV